MTFSALCQIAVGLLPDVVYAWPGGVWPRSIGLLKGKKEKKTSFVAKKVEDSIFDTWQFAILTNYNVETV